jgi:aryl-alcohol dehydrogenase-like predicted oxidoreductase
LVERLREIGNRHGRTPGEVAIAWTLNNPAVTAAIVGFRSVKQVSGIIGAAEFRLLPAEITEIEDALKRELVAQPGGPLKGMQKAVDKPLRKG